MAWIFSWIFRLRSTLLFFVKQTPSWGKTSNRNPEKLARVSRNSQFFLVNPDWYIQSILSRAAQTKERNLPQKLSPKCLIRDWNLHGMNLEIECLTFQWKLVFCDCEQESGFWYLCRHCESVERFNSCLWNENLHTSTTHEWMPPATNWGLL